MKGNLKRLSLKYRAKTFYFASLFLPREVRKDIEILYIFCRFVDDLGDDQSLNKNESFKKLYSIKNDLKKFNSNCSIVMNFISLMKKHSIDSSIPTALVEGVIKDLNDVIIKNYSQLIQYSFSVAGTVGYMFCKIIRIKDKNQFFRGIELGIAMQFTNIARDIKEDILMNRIYLPQEIRTFKGKDKTKILKNKKIQKSISNDLLIFLEKTDEIYLNSWHGIYNLEKKYAIPVAIAAELYRRIGNKIRLYEGNIWNKRVYLNIFEKIFFSILTMLKLFIFKKQNIKKDIDEQIRKNLKFVNAKIL